MAAFDNKYPVPLYLNQQVVFDLLAMMEGGISHIQSIRTSETSQDGKESRVSGEVGVKNVFALLGVSLGGNRTKKEQVDTSRDTYEERVHTPNSLFARVRDRLHDQKLVHEVKPDSLMPGYFVEFRATLRRNPVIDGFNSFIEVQDMASIFADPPTAGPATAQKNRGFKPAPNPNKVIVEQIRKFLGQLNSGDTVDFLGECSSDPQIKIVLTLERAFLADSSSQDIVGGEYTVLGKVTKVIRKPDDESINLLRKTSLGRVQGKLLAVITEAFDALRRDGISVPEIVVDVGAPAIQVFPVAIFA